MIYRRAARHFDYFLLLFAGALVAFGGLLIYSAQLSNYQDGITLGHPLTKQLVFAALGIGITFAVAWLDYRIFGQMSVGLYAIAIVMLVAVLGIGDSAYGSRRWFTVAGQQVQASEIAKLFVIIALARYLADRQAHIHEIQVFVISLVLAAVPAALVLVEPDMGSAMVFGAIWIGMVLMSGVPARHVLALVGLTVSFIPFAMLVVLGDYQRERIRLFFDPNSDPLGGGFNILQAETSIGSGGLFGRGITEGPQTQLDFLQTSTTDYIFAVLGEETGLLGAFAFDHTRFQAQRGFVYDSSGPVGNVVRSSPWGRTIDVVFKGRAAHAGLAPEEGRSAIVAAAKILDYYFNAPRLAQQVDRP